MLTHSKRTVEGNLDNPRLRIQIAPELNYLGNLKTTTLNDVSIDNYYFVHQTDIGNIRRILYFQFEASINDHILNYPTMQTIKINDYPFVYDGGVRPYRSSKIEEQAVASDVRKTVDFLSEQGVHFQEGELYGALRFAHQFDDVKQKDVLIIYLEHVYEADVPADVIAKSRYSDEWQPYCDQLIARALRTFTICED
ncbi:MAG: hypothetical protein AAF846_08255 [Chloroflexota bacterium]